LGDLLAKQVENRSDQITRLIEQADIAQVAQAVGLQIDARRREPRRAICPFHNDKDPSLHLYSKKGNGQHRDHYHCFVCGAHGDAIKLIQEYERLSFPDAAERLAQIAGVPLKVGRVESQCRTVLNAAKSLPRKSMSYACT
jgi:DNA primase